MHFLENYKLPNCLIQNFQTFWLFDLFIYLVIGLCLDSLYFAIFISSVHFKWLFCHFLSGLYYSINLRSQSPNLSVDYLFIVQCCSILTVISDQSSLRMFLSGAFSRWTNQRSIWSCLFCYLFRFTSLLFSNFSVVFIDPTRDYYESKHIRDDI